LVQQQGDLGQGRAAASALGFLQGLTDNLGWKLGMFQPQLRLNHTIYWCIGKSSYNEKKHHDTRLRNW
jgi:hypothetical protein